MATAAPVRRIGVGADEDLEQRELRRERDDEIRGVRRDRVRAGQDDRSGGDQEGQQDGGDDEHRRSSAIGKQMAHAAAPRPAISIPRWSRSTPVVGISPTIRPSYSTTSRSARASSSSRSSDTSTMAAPAALALEQLRANVLGGADVEAARRLRDDHDPRVAREDARQQHLLDVAARERGHRVVRSGPDVEPLDEPRGVLADSTLVDSPAGAELVEPFEDQVVGDGQVADQAGVAILGDPSDPGGHHPRRTGTRQVRVADGDRAARGRAHAGQHVHELGLAIAGDARHAHDLAGTHPERDARERLPAV